MKFEKSYPFPFDTELIKKDCIGKSGVYLILNTVNGKYYIGSASSKSDRHNRLYFRFRNHFYNTEKSTNINLRKAIKKYGIHKFTFNIIVFDSIENILNLEDFYINKLKPDYNILQTALNSLGYKHTEETKKELKLNHSNERKEKIGSLNRNKTLSENTKNLISQSMKLRHELKLVNLEKFKQSRSKPTSVYDLNNKFIKSYSSAKNITKEYSVDYRTIRRHIKSGLPINKLGIIIKYDL